MHSNLNPLPSLLLTHLGAHSQLDDLATLPQFVEAGVTANALRKGKDSQPYHFNLDSQGISVMLQCMNPEAKPEARTWGLQGFTLKAGEWKGDWPTGLDIHEATANDLVAVLAAKPEETMNMPPMLCFTVEGIAGQAWSVMAIFDSSGKLDTFSLLRVGPWRNLVLAPSA